MIAAPRHPYVRLLVDSVPKPDPARRWEGTVELPAEEALRTASSTGCRFAPRCPERMDRCAATPPSVPVGGPGHEAACWLYDGAADAAPGTGG